MQRIGQGYDVHKIAKDRELILGGVNIPFTIDGNKMGLMAHSDGDVLTHAICDALLGAAALGDIGEHFPDTSDTYKNIDSQILLKHVKTLLETKGYHIVNIDATIAAQAPKLSPYKDQMASNISQTLNIAQNQVNIKATTEEGLGITGKNEGMVAHAICLIEKRG